MPHQIHLIHRYYQTHTYHNHVSLGNFSVECIFKWKLMVLWLQHFIFVDSCILGTDFRDEYRYYVFIHIDLNRKMYLRSEYGRRERQWKKDHTLKYSNIFYGIIYKFDDNESVYKSE